MLKLVSMYMYSVELKDKNDTTIVTVEAIQSARCFGEEGGISKTLFCLFECFFSVLFSNLFFILSFKKGQQGLWRCSCNGKILTSLFLVIFPLTSTQMVWEGSYYAKGMYIR